MLLTKPKLGSKNSIRNFPRKSKEFLSGFSFGNRFYSENYTTELENAVLKDEQGLLNSDSSIVTMKMTLFTSRFSEHFFSNDIVRMHRMVERTIWIALGLTPFAYEIYFDKNKKSFKSTFMFFNVKDGERVLGSSGISQEEFTKVSNSIKSKVLNFNGVSLTPTQQITEENIDGATEITAKRSKEVEFKNTETVCDFVSMLGEPKFRSALLRASKSLDYSRSREFLDVINRMIEVNADGSVKGIEMPQKYANQERSYNRVKVDKNLTENMSDLFTI